MKSTYLNNLIEESHILLSRMNSRVWKAGLVAIVVVIVWIGIYGCKKQEPQEEDITPTESVEQEPQKEDMSPTESVSMDNVNKIAFASNRDENYEIYVMNADGSGLKRLTNNADDGLFPSWSPDGSKMTFELRTDKNPEIYVMNANGSERKNLTNDPSRDHVPSWSPDGKKIAFYSLKDGNYEIYVMNPDGSKKKRLTKNRSHDMGPSWSPDGMR